jgi:D-alanine-D-alanine ligase
MSFKEKKIGVLMGGQSAEREVSLQTGRAILEALQRRGYDALEVDPRGADICAQLVGPGVQVAFVALHGTYGEDGCIQGLLEILQLPYTGSGIQASALAMDKVTTKKLLQLAGVPVPDWRYPASEKSARALGLPLVIKPRRQGSSVGLSVVHNWDQLERALALGGDALAERYIPGRELSVGVLGAGAEARCLGTVEIRPAAGLYDYEAKYGREDTRYLAPAPVPRVINRRMEQLALQVHRLLECRGGTRTDFRWDEQGDPVVLELNTIPGMTSHSLLPMVAGLQGMTYDDLVEALLQGAALELGA